MRGAGNEKFLFPDQSTLFNYCQSCEENIILRTKFDHPLPNSSLGGGTELFGTTPYIYVRIFEIFYCR
jgi:hypothetical protein